MFGNGQRAGSDDVKFFDAVGKPKKLGDGDILSVAVVMKVRQQDGVTVFVAQILNVGGVSFVSL